MDSILSPALPILIVDDEPSIIRSVVTLLTANGLTNMIQCTDSREVMKILHERPVSTILLDLIMPYLTGESLLPQIIEAYPEMSIIVVTGRNDVDVAVRCMRLGAFDYLLKPVRSERLILTVKRAIEVGELRNTYASLKKRVLSQELEHPEAFSAILTMSMKMKAVFQFAEAVARSSKPVLITGETGVGKELLAKAIHQASGRKGAFVAINVAGVDDDAFSDTLFGHLRGAFTGAETTRPGLIARAALGTIFLDEIGDLSPASQVKLLRLLQEREYFPLGADTPKLSDASVMVATNRNLTELVAQGGFRKDLYYRLQTHQIVLPPLRERTEDIPILLDHFLSTSATALAKKKPTPPPELATLLTMYPFPGNIRELESMVYRAVSRHVTGKLSMESFKELIGKERAAKSSFNADPALQAVPLNIPDDAFPTLKEGVEFLVSEAIRRTNGNQSLAADLLGITPSALNKRLHRAVQAK